MESAPAMEINMDAFGNFFLTIPTAGWKAKNAFHTYRQARRRSINPDWKQNHPCLITGKGVEETLSVTSLSVGRF